jgi:hypothetical protein
MTTVPADRQLPQGEEIFLDHVAHFVADRDAAARALARAGFSPTPVSIQQAPDAAGVLVPTGTGNTCAMLERGYLEILFKTADTPLARELDAALARHPGVHLAAFAVADAASARARLAQAGFRVRPLVAMQRPVATETGEGTAAFTIARIEPGQMPEGRIQILTHRTEATVWQPRWLTHPNTAHALVAIVIAVADPGEAAARFGRFAGRPARKNRQGATIALDRGHLELVTAEAFADIVPGVAIPSLPFIGSYALAVRSLEVAAKVLHEAALPAHRLGKALVAPFPPPLGRGAFLFVEDAADLPRA